MTFLDYLGPIWYHSELSVDFNKYFIINPIHITNKFVFFFQETQGVCVATLKEKVAGEEECKFPSFFSAQRWFSVGISKYKPGYKSHDLL